MTAVPFPMPHNQDTQKHGLLPSETAIPPFNIYESEVVLETQCPETAPYHDEIWRTQHPVDLYEHTASDENLPFAVFAADKEAETAPAEAPKAAEEAPVAPVEEPAEAPAPVVEEKPEESTPSAETEKVTAPRSSTRAAKSTSSKE